MRRLLGELSQIGCGSSCRLRDCDLSSLTRLIIPPSDSSDSKSDDISDDNSDSEMIIGVVARSPAIASVTVAPETVAPETVARETLANKSRQARCSRLLFTLPNSLPLSLPLSLPEQPCHDSSLSECPSTSLSPG